ncbi:SCP2 sterol-binding domain-containing protein, partial [Klebsiella pneumoniae]|nr:SCP2 sterol-binding domain-containing protein [Klebsiella pneumoniae]
QPVVRQNAQADVSFWADDSDLLMIAARKQDPDKLFCQRRLVIEGDTELGLYVKNLMDAIELEQMPKALRMMLLQLADFVEAGMETPPETKQASAREQW